MYTLVLRVYTCGLISNHWITEMYWAMATVYIAYTQYYMGQCVDTMIFGGNVYNLFSWILQASLLFYWPHSEPFYNRRETTQHVMMAPSHGLTQHIMMAPSHGVTQQVMMDPSHDQNVLVHAQF